LPAADNRAVIPADAPMNDEQRLLERLRLIEALHAGAATPGERDAAAQARDRIRARLRAMEHTDPPVEYSFKLRDRWSHQLFTALLRRYEIKPYRYRGQRYTTVMARVPKRFVNETLWPEFTELNRTLANYLADVTRRVITEGIAADTSDVEERAEPSRLTGGAGAVGMGEAEAG
jgi:hypothetical protein